MRGPMVKSALSCNAEQPLKLGLVKHARRRRVKKRMRHTAQPELVGSIAAAAPQSGFFMQSYSTAPGGWPTCCLAGTAPWCTAPAAAWE